jgi:hypothetical protein
MMMEMTKMMNEFCEIILTQNQVALVSVHRFDELSRFKWQARWAKNTQSFYATRTERRGNKRVTILMHRQILGLDYGDQRQGDHVKPNMTLDNRDENLRIADRNQQAHNKRKCAINTSGLKGVTFHKVTQKWLAQIAVNQKRIYLGVFSTKELAYEAYCKAARLHFGEFACLA